MYIKMTPNCWLLLLVLIGIHGVSTNSPQPIINACCVCGDPIDATIVVGNQLQEPFFEMKTEVKSFAQRELIFLMEEAATQDVRFRFGADHFGSLGYMITKINNLSASVKNQTYWHISSYFTDIATASGLAVGVSSYTPGHKETFMFNFTSYATSDGH